MQRPFLCPNCGADTIRQSHAHKCPVFTREEVARQSVEKALELGLVFEPEKYQLPLRLEGS